MISRRGLLAGVLATAALDWNPARFLRRRPVVSYVVWEDAKLSDFADMDPWASVSAIGTAAGLVLDQEILFPKLFVVGES